jgi:hypothetical protein
MHLLSCLKPVTYHVSLRIKAVKSQGNFELFESVGGPLGGAFRGADGVGDRLRGARLLVGDEVEFTGLGSRGRRFRAGRVGGSRVRWRVRSGA